MFDWNDLRYFLAVAREGSVGAAARVIGVDPSTVQRRLKALEQATGRTLVERKGHGYTLTKEGNELLSQAERMEGVAGDFQRTVNSLDTSSTGQVKVASLVTVGHRIIKSGLIDCFQKRYPGIHIEMILGQRVVNLAAGEADIAIRGGAQRSDALIGRKICEVPWAVFASQGYVEKYGRPASISSLRTHRIIELVDEIEKLPAAKWLRANAPNARVAARCGNIPSAHLAVKSGAGIAVLPYVYAASDDDLVCLTGPIPELNYPMYLLVHKDMRKVRRVSTFFDFCSRELKTVLLSGNMRAR